MYNSLDYRDPDIKKEVCKHLKKFLKKKGIDENRNSIFEFVRRELEKFYESENMQENLKKIEGDKKRVIEIYNFYQRRLRINETIPVEPINKNNFENEDDLKKIVAKLEEFKNLLVVSLFQSWANFILNPDNTNEHIVNVIAAVTRFKRKNTRLIILILFLLFIVFFSIIFIIDKVKENKVISDNQFDVIQKYTHENKMGDINDINNITIRDGVVSFTYTTQGKGPHEWTYKYLDNGQLNPEPAKFAGLAWLHPTGNWGFQKGGFDLRQYKKRITWEARCENCDSVYATAKMGGIRWVWKENRTETSPFQDSMDETKLADFFITENWQEYEFNTEKMPDSLFKKVLCPFLVVINWSNNKIGADSLNKPINPKTFKISLRNIFYHAE